MCRVHNNAEGSSYGNYRSIDLNKIFMLKNLFVVKHAVVRSISSCDATDNSDGVDGDNSV
jgi:hypothetical protein